VILVLSGTAEGRAVVRALVDAGHRVLASAATNYGARLLFGCGGEVIAGRLGLEEMSDLMRQRGVRLVVDATHPYARLVTDTAIKACRQLKLPYLRYQRPATVLPAHPLILSAADYEEAAVLAVRQGGTIFLTTGSKTLCIFMRAARECGRRVVARVLPEPAVLEKCFRLGLTPADIVALQGPCSRELNRALFEQYRAGVLVTKDGGAIGGTDAKIAAALDLNLPVVVIRRPPPPPGAIGTVDELLRRVNQLI